MGFFQGVLSKLHNATLSPEEQKQREEAKKNLEIVKIASVISVIVAGFFLAVFPSFFTLFTLGIIAFGASEVHKVAENFSRILATPFAEIPKPPNEAFAAQLTQNTFLIGPILRIINT